MKHLYYYCSDNMDPWKNQAIEEFLMEQVPEDSLMLYLWQNRRTVVVGKNQNTWAECDVNWLHADGGFAARRLSGGGSVYHDEQNLNFTFAAQKSAYDVSVQTEIIVRAVQSFGLDARRTGRNDIVADGRKFSGNAYFEKNGRCLHHGTLLINTDTEAMNRYLHVAREKLKSKGVSSVRSRVVNLQELNPLITVETMKNALKTAFGSAFKLEIEEWKLQESDLPRINALEEKFSSWEWIYGRKIPFTWSRRAFFSWGSIEILLYVNSGIIEKALIYSDAIDAGFIGQIQEKIVGSRFCQIRENWFCNMTDLQKQMFSDIHSMIADA